MADVRQTQRVNAYFQKENTYAGVGKGTTSPGALSHIGLLDTFDPRMLDHQYAAVSTIGQSVAPHILKGATKVTVPLKIGMWGDGWKTLLGSCIGQTTINSAARPAFLTTDVQTMAIIAEEQLPDATPTWQGSLASGVALNKATLDLDFTTNAPAMIDFDATAYYVVDEATASTTRTAARTFAGDFIAANYASLALPSEPTGDPILPNDVSIQYSTGSMSEGVTIDGPANSYVEVGERFMLFYTSAGALSAGVPNGDDASIPVDGVIDLAHANADTVAELAALDASGWTGWTVAALGGASADLTTNLQKGVYLTTSAKNIYMPSTMVDWPYVKTAKLTIDNQHIPLPGAASSVTDSSIKKILEYADVARGESIITLEITSTAKDETFYDQMVTGTALPLVRLDFGTNGSIALTNGRIMTRTAGYTAGAEVAETVTMQFYGAGDYSNYSKYAISGDF